MQTKNIALIVGLFVLIGGGYLFAHATSVTLTAENDNTQTPPLTEIPPQQPPTPEPVTPSSTSSEVATSKYKDGSYTTASDYRTPEGPETINVTLTLKNDVITDSSLNMTNRHEESGRFQSMFAANYKPLVIGKQIDTVKLSRVSGSSLTSSGFNAALEKIKVQAQG